MTPPPMLQRQTTPPAVGGRRHSPRLSARLRGPAHDATSDVATPDTHPLSVAGDVDGCVGFAARESGGRRPRGPEGDRAAGAVPAAMCAPASRLVGPCSGRPAHDATPNNQRPVRIPGRDPETQVGRRTRWARAPARTVDGEIPGHGARGASQFRAPGTASR